MEEIWIDDPTVEVCLNCKQLWCSGECDDVKDAYTTVRYAIRRMFVSMNGVLHVAYITKYDDMLRVSKNIKKSKKFRTIRAARDAVLNIRRKDPRKDSKYEIIRTER